MKFFAVLALASLAAALPQTVHNQVSSREAGEKRQSIIEQLQSTFDRDNPNGTPTSAGDPDDLNGDGVINAFEAGAQAA